MIGTDHSPHSSAEKQQSHFKAPSDLPPVQHAMLEHYHDGRMDLPFIARETSHAVTERFQIADRGFIREGYWADLLLIDLQRRPPCAVRICSICAAGRPSRARPSVFQHLVRRTRLASGKLHPAPLGQRLHFLR